MARPTKFSPELKDRAVRLVLEHQHEYGSRYGAIGSVAGKIGCNPETLRGWVRRVETDAGARPGMTTEKRARLTALEREMKELRRAKQILRNASAHLAWAELDFGGK